MRCLGIALAIALFACSPAPEDEENADVGPSCDPTAAAPASVPALEVLGETSKDHYEVVTPDAELLRHDGPQGGQHFWIRVRLFAATESVWSFDAELVDGTGLSVASGQRGFTACEAMWVEPREITVFLEELNAPVTGTLRVTANGGQLPPFELPIRVP